VDGEKFFRALGREERDLARKHRRICQLQTFANSVTRVG
jgi:hypothetical protein